MRILLLCLTLVATSLHANADELTAEKRADIRRMMEASGSARMGSQMARLTQAGLRQSLRACSNCTAKTFEVIDREAEALFSARAKEKGGLLDRMVEVYHKHFSHAEVREMIAFYNSPIGKRVAAVTPLIAQEGLGVGQTWSKGLMEELQKNVRTALAKEKLPYPELQGAPAGGPALPPPPPAPSRP